MVTQWFEWLLLAVCAVLGVTVIPYLRARLGQEKAQALHTLIVTAVQAAEQLFPLATGAQKLQYVLEVLEANRVPATDTVRAEIEAAVHNLPKENTANE